MDKTVGPQEVARRQKRAAGVCGRGRGGGRRADGEGPSGHRERARRRPRGAGADPPGAARREARVQRARHRLLQRSGPRRPARDADHPGDRARRRLAASGRPARHAHLGAHARRPRLSGASPRACARWRSATLLASVRGIGLSVMDLAKQKPGALDKAADAARIAVEQDGADVLVLGCMSMAFLPGICEAPRRARRRAGGQSRRRRAEDGGSRGWRCGSRTARPPGRCRSRRRSFEVRRRATCRRVRRVRSRKSKEIVMSMWRTLSGAAAVAAVRAARTAGRCRRRPACW